jgi:uncharacterized membrane protein YvlD (DUF360 family)
MAVIAPFILILLYRKVGIGGAFVIGLTGVFMQHVVASLNLGLTAFFCGLAFGNLGSNLFMLTLSIWMSTQSHPYAIVGVVQGSHQFWTFVGVKLATSMSNQNWPWANFYRISAPFTVALVASFWFVFRDESPLKYNSQNADAVSFRESFRTKFVWLFAVSFTAAGAALALAIPQSLEGFKIINPQPVAVGNISTFFLIGSLGNVVIGYGINALEARQQHRTASYLSLLAMLSIGLFELVGMQFLRIIFYDLAVFLISPINSFLFILAASVMPRELYIQGVRSAIIGSLAISIVWWILLAIMLIILIVLAGTLPLSIAIASQLLLLYYCYYQVLKQTAD